MPTLRKIVRDTLDARAPNDRDARADLARIVAKVDERRSRRTLAWVTLPAAVAAAAVIVVVIVGRKPDVPQSSSSHLEPAAGGIHLYLRSGDEPEDRAISLDLDVKGEH